MAQPALASARERRTVADVVAGFDQAQLEKLLRGRPDLASPAPKDLAALAAKACTWPSLNSCLAGLDRACTQVLDALALLPQPSSVGALAEFMGVGDNPSELSTPLARLQDLAMVFAEGDRCSVHPMLATRSGIAGLGPPARSLLAPQTPAALEDMAKRWGAKGSRVKAETLLSVIRAIADPALVEAALRSAPPGTEELARAMAERPYVPVPGGTYFIRSDTPLGWLRDRGMAVAESWERAVMPREAGLALRRGRPFTNLALRAPDIAWQPRDPAAVERSAGEQALRVVVDLAAVVDSWEAAPPKLLKAGGIGIREVRRAASAVGRGEVDAARLVELAGVAGLAGWSRQAQLALARKEYDDWVSAEMADRWLVVVRAWLSSELHLSVAGATGINGKPIAPLIDRGPEEGARRRRRMVLEALLAASPGQAADAATLTAAVAWQAPALWAGGPARPETLVRWVVEEAEILGLAASGALSTLGRAVVNGDFDQARDLVAAGAPPITTRFVVQADLTAVATGPLEGAVRTRLETMADLESTGAATVYRFSEASVRRAFEQGETAPKILEFLAGHASKGVPQPLSYLVEDVGRRHGQVRVGVATCYLRSDDPALVAELLAARRLAKLNLRPLAPTVVVSTAQPKVVLASLRDSGCLAAEEDAAGALVVRRSERLRAAMGHKPGSAKLDTPDELKVKEVARRLANAKRPAPSRATPPAPTAATSRAKPGQKPAAAPAPFPQLRLVPEESERPREIARSEVAIAGLVDLAVKYEWLLRLGYTSQRGRSQQLTAAILAVQGTQVAVGTPPTFTPRSLNLGRIEWARALTEAEEEAL